LTALVAILPPLAIGVSLVMNAFTSLLSSSGLLAIGITALVAALGTAVLMYAEHVGIQNRLKSSTESLAAINDKVANQYKADREKIDMLVGVLKDQKSNLDDIKYAKNELIRINPAFKKSLDGEIVDYNQLNVSVNDYIANLERLAKRKELSAKIDANIALKNKIIEDPSTNISTIQAIYNGYNRLIYGDDTVNSVIAQRNARLIIQLTEQNKTYADEMMKLGSDMEGATPTTAPLKTIVDEKGLADGEKAQKKLTKLLEDHNKDVEDWATKRRKRIDEIEKDNRKEALALSIAMSPEINVKNLPKAPKKEWDTGIDWQTTFGNVKPLEGLSDKERTAWEEVNKMQEKGMTDYQKRIADFPNEMKNVRQDLQNMSVDLMSDMVSGLISGDGIQGAMKSALSAFGNFAIQLGKHILPMAKMLKKLKIKPTPENAYALIAGGSIIKGIANSMQVPAFAQGGMVTNPTYAMLGDNSSGKEMVLPFEKTGEFASMIANSMGAGGGYEFQTVQKIKAEHIELITTRRKKQV